MMHGTIDFDREPTVPLDENGVARTGQPKPPDVPAADEAAVVAALKTCYDPEIPVDIYDLGLIYELEIHANGDVDVAMTLTAPGCPVAGTLPGDVAEAVAGVEGVGQVAVRLTWDPPWDPSRMTEAARFELNMW
jgi:FeS assembly SUF system protein